MINLRRHLAAPFVAIGLLGTTGAALAQNWVDQPNMVVPRVESSAVEYRDDIYVFNGFKPGIKIANSVEKYDAATKQWSIIGSTTVLNASAVTHNGIVRVGTDVWIIGGRVGSHPGRVSDRVWIFSLDSQDWRRGPDLPVPGAAGGTALINNKIHWFGGLDTQASCDVGTHLIYDLNSKSDGWQDISSVAGMPMPRNHFATAVVDRIIYAMGGQFGHGGCPGTSGRDSALVHAFDPETNEWSQKADMPNVNSHSEPGTFVYQGDIYSVGGESVKNKVWKYNPRANTWSTIATLAEDLIAPVARIIDGRLIVAGGGAPNANSATNRVRSILIDGRSEPKPEPTPQPTPEPTPEPAPEPTPEPTPQPNPEPTPEPTTQPNPAPTPEPTTQPNPAPTPEPTPVQVPGSGTPQGPTTISMEAEYFDINNPTSTHQWVTVSIGNSSNDNALITTPDQGTLAGTTEDTPMLSYLVYFNHPGKHYIWVRGLGDTDQSGEGNSDSIKIGINGKLADTAFRIDQFPAEWTWSRNTPNNPVASLNIVEAGVNMINIWMREDGLAIDKFVITSDPDFVPNGFGPDVTDGTADYERPAPLDDATADSNGDSGERENHETLTESDSSEDSLPRNDETDVANIIATDNGSNGGLFSGSASTAMLCVLFLICVGRIRRTRLV